MKKCIFNTIFKNKHLNLFSSVKHTKFGPDRLSRFDGNWIQTNRQAKCIYRRGAIIILSIFNNLFIIIECSEDYENIETILGYNLFKQEIVQVSDAVNLQTVFVKEDDVKIEIKGKSLLIFCIF